MKQSKATANASKYQPPLDMEPFMTKQSSPVSSVKVSQSDIVSSKIHLDIFSISGATKRTPTTKASTMLNVKAHLSTLTTFLDVDFPYTMRHALKEATAGHTKLLMKKAEELSTPPM